MKHFSFIYPFGEAMGTSFIKATLFILVLIIRDKSQIDR